MNRKQTGRGTIRMLLLALALGVGAGRAQAGPYDTWSYRLKLSFTNAIPGELTNFPVLVSLHTGVSGFDYGDFVSPANGADLRFSDADESRELNYEIERWDTNGVSQVWVEVPLITGTGTFIHAYWGNEAGTPAFATNGATWTNGFVGVWHMSEANSPVADWSRRGSNGATIGSGVLYDQTGVVGRAVRMTQSGGYGGIKVNDSAVLDFGSGSFTVELWQRKEQGSSGWSNIGDMHKWWTGGQAGQNEWSLLTTVTGGDNRPNFMVEIGTTTYSCSSPDNIAINTWNHIAGVRDGTTLRIYVNGVQKGSVTGVSGSINNVGRDLYFGYFPISSNLSIRSSIDEARISATARQTNWVHACWLNQKADSPFVTFGVVEPLSVSPVGLGALPAEGVTATAAWMRGEVTGTGGGGNPHLYFCWDSTDKGIVSGTGVWSHVDYVGNSWGEGQSFSNRVTTLQSGSNYVYRIYGTNTAGEGWSTARSFQTAVPPTVANNGGTEAGAAQAWLRGTVTDTGRETPQAGFLYWVAGSDTTNAFDAGLQSGAFSNLVTGLQPATDYIFLVTASNSAGLALSATNGFRTVAAGDIRFRGGAFDGWDRDELVASAGLGGAQVSLSSGTHQTFAWTAPSAALAMLTITATAPAGTITNGGILRITVPPLWGCRFDTGVSVTLGGAASNKVGTANYADGGRTLVIPVESDFTAGDILTVSGLILRDLALGRVGSQRLELDFTGNGLRDETDTHRLTLTVSWRGGAYDGWDRDELAASAGLGGAEVSFSSGTDQSFAWTAPSASLAMLTITATDPAGMITNGGLLRVTVPPAWGCRFDSGVSVTLEETASGKVGSAYYADGDRTLAIPVTANFTAGDVLTISGLVLRDLALGRVGSQRLELDFTGDGLSDTSDEHTLTLLVPWRGGAYDGWDAKAMLESTNLRYTGSVFSIR